MASHADPQFGRLLKRYRRAAHLTQEDLAERAGYSSHYVSMLERGVRRPPPVTAEVLADALALQGAERAGLRVAADGGPPVDSAPREVSLQGAPLLGREQDVARLVSLQQRDDTRLITLTGPGGVGKSRLAEHTAALLAPRFAHGTAVVDLAVLSDPHKVVPVIARAFKLRDAGNRPPWERLIAFMQPREILLVLDSFEGVLEAAPLVGALLRACPRLTVLITSRAPLQVRGEQEYRVQPLACPAPELCLPPDALLHYPAVALFLHRARLLNPDFALDDEGAALVAAICRQVDALPLAIELAAACTKHLPLPALRDRLEHRLRVLTGGLRDGPARHQRMRDTVAWSYDLLLPTEQAMFRQLSIFVGTWSLAGSEVVVGAAEHAETVLDGLRTLVDKSLVVLEDASQEEPRYRMLDTLREYAAEQLIKAGEEEAVRRRHAAYYVRLAELAEPALQGTGQGVWYRRLETEHDNVRSALRWLLANGEIEAALRLAGALWRFWQRHGDLREGRQWLDEGLSHSAPVPPEVRSRALWGASWLAYHQGEYGRTRTLSAAHLVLARERSDALAMRNALTGLGMADLAEGRYVDAVPPLREGLSLCRSLGNTWHLATSCLNLGVATLLVGDEDGAAALLEEALTLYQRGGDEVFSARSQAYLGYLAVREGDWVRAETLLEHSLRGFVAVEEKIGIADGLEAMAALRAARGSAERAARISGAVAVLRESIGAHPFPFDHVIWQHYLVSAREQLGAVAWTTAWEEGRALSLDQAVAAALRRHA